MRMDEEIVRVDPARDFATGRAVHLLDVPIGREIEFLRLRPRHAVKSSLGRGIWFIRIITPARALR